MSFGLSEALHTLAWDFGNLMVLTQAFMRELFGMNDKTKVRDMVNNLR